ncbi:hypothetical protein ACM66B_003052 [Microbotryomycetes sp. NB124-2]
MPCDRPTDSRTSSILSYVDEPSFDSSTGQLSTVRHHVLDGPATISSSFAPQYITLLPEPPAEPFQAVGVDTADHKPRKRRRKAKSFEDRTPLDWINARHEYDKLHVPDQQERKHHAQLLPLLEAGISSLQDAHTGKVWVASESGQVEWLLNKAQGPLEAPFAEAVSSSEGIVRSKSAMSGDDVSQPVQIESLVGRIVTNDSQHFHELKIAFKDAKDDVRQSIVALPPSSAFALSDFATWSDPNFGLAKLGQQHRGWDIIILDPPWPNASASRSASYDTFDPYSLGKLDLKAILGSSPALVACWVTNRVKYRKLLKEKLMPSWGVDHVSEWYWIKTTTQGEPVWPLAGVHRRCYESLILGWFNAENETRLPALPQSQLFMSVPLGHSRKPSILELLEPCLPHERRSSPNVLELFARTALAGKCGHDGHNGLYCSVGNECIKFNVVQEEAGDWFEGWLQRKT